MMATNDDIREQLSAYLDGELPPAEAQQVDAALKSDAALSEELRQLRATRELLQALPRQSLGDEFAGRVMQAAAEKGVSGRSIRTGGRGRRIFSVAAVVIVAMGVGLVVAIKMYPPTTGEGQPAATTTRDLGRVARGMEELDEDKSVLSDEAEAGRDDMKKDTYVYHGKKATDISAGRPIARKGGDVRPVTRKPIVIAKPSAPAKKAGYPGKLGVPAPTAPAPRRRIGKGAPPEYAGKKAAEMRDGEIVTLAALARNNADFNEDIYTDNLPREQRNVERVIVGNGIKIASTNQRMLLSNQVSNLNSNTFYNRKMNRAAVAEDVEVEYLVYGEPEKLEKLRTQLQRQVAGRQVVPQLSEPRYQRILADTSGEKLRSDKPLAEAKTEDEAGICKSEPMTTQPATKTPTEREGISRRVGQLTLTDRRNEQLVRKLPVTRPAEPGAAQSRPASTRPTSQTAAQTSQSQPRGRAEVQRELAFQQPQASLQRRQAQAMLITLRYRRPAQLNRFQQTKLKRVEHDMLEQRNQRRARQAAPTPPSPAANERIQK